MATRENPHELVELAREYYVSGFGRGPEFFEKPGSIVASVHGNYFTDIFGRQLFDTESCASAAYLGFGLPEVMQALREEMERVPSTTPLFVPTAPLLRLAEKLASITPGSLKYSVFAANGTDATEGAVKIARQYWKARGKGGKFKVLHRIPGDYHGMSLAMVSASGHTFRRAPYEPLMGGFVAFNAPYCYRCPYEHSLPGCRLLCARDLERVIQFEGPDSIACVITENTNTGLGIVTPPPGYMPLVRDICTRYDVLLIADEIITGIAKTGAWFESGKQGIVPDMLCIGKAISAGCGALAATHVTEEIGQVLAESGNLHHGFTYGGLGYLAAAGLAGIAYVERHGLLQRALDIERYMGNRMETLKSRSRIVGDVRMSGVLQGIELVKDRQTKSRFEDPRAVAAFIGDVGREHDVLLSCQFPHYGNIITMYLPLTSTDKELGKVCDAIEDAVRRVETAYA
ncbi:MAG: aminotransferase class III-fold pyridoxal phosphate-dependent enzyme [Dehalococcoidia bacterium]|jgi:adenosylmethionine-8-amino-7-oxononanoate aminotransferase|nr:aminotransferase class III-fold pyridoxal phosphate-dependent enzyme [Dehalococcoidia bacterium]